MSKRYLFLAIATAVVALLASSCGLLSMRRGAWGSNTSHEGVPTDKQIMLIGTYTDAGSEGVYSYTAEIGSLDFKHTGTFITPNPTCLAYDGGKRIVYIANEDNEQPMATSAQLDTRNGRLSAINSSYTLGDGPAYIATDGKNKVVTANYSGGSITLFEVNAKGELGQPDWRIVLGKERVSHPHAAIFSPNGKELFITDLGMDKVFHFNVNASSNPPITIGINTTSLPSGVGPRHIIMDRSGKYAYVIAEKAPKIFVYEHHDGALELVQEVGLRLASGAHGQHMVLSDDGRFLYTSHTDGEHVISIFKVDKGDGTLTQVGKQKVGKKPRQFAISPDGSVLAVACRGGDKVEFYQRDASTGLLTPIQGAGLKVSHPAFILWLGQH